MEHFGFKVMCGAFMAYSLLAVNAQMEHNRKIQHLIIEQTNQIKRIHQTINNKTTR
jgi:hypothetical protein